MPWKLLGVILLGVVLITLLGLNLDNKSDIDFWFNDSLKLENVSICLSFPMVFILGMLSTLPFLLSHSISNSRAKKKKEITSVVPVTQYDDDEDDDTEDDQ